MLLRLKHALILTPALLAVTIWFYPASMAASKFTIPVGLGWGLLFSFGTAYSVTLFVHALKKEDQR